MLHTVTVPNAIWEGEKAHGLVHFHDGRAMVEDSLTVTYDSIQTDGDNWGMRSKTVRVLDLLVEEGCTDLGPIYTNLAEATAGPSPATRSRLAPFDPDRKE